MFPPFLDGLSQGLPPDVIEFSRDPSNASGGDSFAAHLRREPKPAETNSTDPPTDAQQQDDRVESGNAEPERDDLSKGRADAPPTTDAEPETPVVAEKETESPDELVLAEVEVVVAEVVVAEVVVASEVSEASLVDPQEAPSVVMGEVKADAQEDPVLLPTVQATGLARQIVEGTAEVADTGDVKLRQVDPTNQELVQEATAETETPGQRGQERNPGVAHPEPVPVEAVAAVQSLTVAAPATPATGVEAAQPVKSERKRDGAPTPVVTETQTADAEKRVAGIVVAIAESVARESNQAPEVGRETEIAPTTPPSAEGKAETVPATAPDRFAQQLNVSTGERSTRQNATSDINQTRFVDRVARAFRVSEGEGGVVKLRLHPPELGALQVQLKVQGNALTAKLEAETPAARALLVESLPVLRERLAEQGIRIEQFDIDLMERQPQNQPERDRQQAPDDRSSENPTSIEGAVEEAVVETPPARGDGNQQLNIFV